MSIFSKVKELLTKYLRWVFLTSILVPKKILGSVEYSTPVEYSTHIDQQAKNRFFGFSRKKYFLDLQFENLFFRFFGPEKGRKRHKIIAGVSFDPLRFISRPFDEIQNFDF